MAKERQIRNLSHSSVKKWREQAKDNTHIVTDVDLSNGLPFPVSSDSVHLSLIHRDTAICNERGFRVVEFGHTVAPSIVGNLMVIPDGDPGEVLMTQNQVMVRSVGGMSLPIIIKSIDLSVRQGDAADGVAPAILTISVLVDVVSKMKHIIDGVFAHRVSVRVEVSKGVVAARVDSQVD